MNKFYYVLALTFFYFNVSAQTLSGYGFSAFNRAFVPLTGANVIWNPLGMSTVVDAIKSKIPIGFPFVYAGSNYDTLFVSSNGFLVLASYTPSGIINTGTNDLKSVQYGAPILAPLWDDLIVPTGAKVSYNTTGTAGSRIFTLEWLNMGWDYFQKQPTLSFQVKLYESNGDIEFTYRQEGNTPVNPSASIGINNASSTDFWWLGSTSASLTATYGGNPATNLTFRPATGQVYRWSTHPVVQTPTATITQPSCTKAFGLINIAGQSAASYSIDGINYKASNVFDSLTAGTYTIYVKNNWGQDSTTGQVINAPLVVPTAPSATLTQPICGSRNGSITIATQPNVTYSISSSNYVSSNVFNSMPSGTYTIYVKSTTSGGCVASTTGQVINAYPGANPAVTVAGSQLTSAQAGATSYQWLDCNRGFAAIAAATAASYSPSHSGSYAVLVSYNGCTDTSNCASIVFAGVEDLANEAIHVYPSPASDYVRIDNLSKGTISIRNVLGQEVFTTKVTEEKKELKVPISQFPRGIYYVTFNSSAVTRTFVKE